METLGLILKRPYDYLCPKGKILGRGCIKGREMFGPLVIKPSKSKGDKTGSWRIQLRPKYLQKNCIACKMCVLICPEGCVTGSEKNTFICDYNYCKGCGLCAQICPKADIAMVEESGEGEKK